MGAAHFVPFVPFLRAMLSKWHRLLCMDVVFSIVSWRKHLSSESRASLWRTLSNILSIFIPLSIVVIIIMIIIMHTANHFRACAVYLGKSNSILCSSCIYISLVVCIVSYLMANIHLSQYKLNIRARDAEQCQRQRLCAFEGALSSRCIHAN